MQWDCYWNEGSPAAQSRFYDNVVIADRPIGPARSPVNPRLVKSAFSDPDPGDTQSGWQLQLASSPMGGDIVWDSGTIAGPGTNVRASEGDGVAGQGGPGRSAYHQRAWSEGTLRVVVLP